MNATQRKRWVVAVDGGGSKISIAAQLCADNEPPPDSLDAARLWTFAHSGSAHPSVWPAAQHHLAEALNVASHALTLSEAGCPLRHILFALAGAGRPAEQSKVLEWAGTLPPPFNCASISCVSDIEPLIDHRRVQRWQEALESGQASAEALATAGPGITGENRSDVKSEVTSVAVILGTGSMVATRDRNCQIVRAGGWGPHLGDECSGGAFGVAVLRSVIQWLDTGGTVEKLSPLGRAVLTALPHRQEWMVGASDAAPAADTSLIADGKLDCDKLACLLIETAANRASAAALAHVVLELAFEQRDPEALGLVDSHVEHVTWQIEQVVQRANLDPAAFELVFSGGLAANYPALREALLAACRARGLSPGEAVVAEPLLACLRLAFTAECRNKGSS